MTPLLMLCSSSTLATHTHDSKKGARFAHGSSNSSYREREAFLKKYDAMSLDEVSAALMVTFKDLVSVTPRGSKQAFCKLLAVRQ